MNGDSYCYYFDNPIIAAVRDICDLNEALRSNVSSIFLLTGTLLNIKDIVTECKGKKFIFLHVDLIAGLDSDFEALRYLAEAVRPNGIISTRNNVIKNGKVMGFCTIQRYFCMDSLAFRTGIRTIEQTNPDIVEVLPGVIPKAVAYMVSQLKNPIITGGMVTTKEDVIAALQNGAIAVSTSCKELWNK